MDEQSDPPPTTARSALMARVRGRNTGPERIVRRALHAIGKRFRLHQPDLPGRPDVVLPRYRLAIFVHGCFWHRHSGCRLASTPKTRTDFWLSKFAANVARDARNVSALQAAGWRVATIWECETRKPADLARSLGALFASDQVYRLVECANRPIGANDEDGPSESRSLRGRGQGILE